MNGKVLVVGADERLSKALEFFVPGITVKAVDRAVDTEGLGVDVVVIAGDHPLEELTEVRVHPNLYAAPIVLFAPGHSFSELDWHRMDVWPVAGQGIDAVDEMTEHVTRLVSRNQHPAGAGAGVRAVSRTAGSVPAA